MQYAINWHTIQQTKFSKAIMSIKSALLLRRLLNMVFKTVIYFLLSRVTHTAFNFYSTSVSVRIRPLILMLQALCHFSYRSRLLIGVWECAAQIFFCMIVLAFELEKCAMRLERRFHSSTVKLAKNITFCAFWVWRTYSRYNQQWCGSTGPGLLRLII